MRSVSPLLILLLLIGLLTGSSATVYGQRILIAAASDMKFALDSILSVYKKANPKAVVNVTYGSSGKLYEQILRGAPFDMFFSADLVYPQLLKKQNQCSGDVMRYGEGRIVVWSNRKDISVDGIKVLASPKIKKIAIANPLHAPYGKRAVESLTHYNLYALIKPKLVYGENISQAAQFITSGGADAGVIALSLALSPAMKHSGGSYYLIPRGSHQVMEQGFVVLRASAGNKAVAAFTTFFAQEASQKILTYFGFLNSP